MKVFPSSSPCSLAPTCNIDNYFFASSANNNNTISGVCGLTLAEENALLWKKLDQNDSELKKAKKVTAKVSNKLNKLEQERKDAESMINAIMITVQENKDDKARLSKELAESNAENAALKLEVVKLSKALEGSQVEIAVLKEDVACTSGELKQALFDCITLKEEISNVTAELEERKSKVAALREDRARLWKRLKIVDAPQRLATIMEAREEEERISEKALKNYLSDTESTRLRKKSKSCVVAQQPRNFVWGSVKAPRVRSH